ncbi:MAG: hypothetical protein OEW31_02790 [Thermoleophilia bacterium]|nr:hypothetical protein [Thermoleophilia bacterium]MDH4345242.1 hypothetical protein [Thermoleophilia bacterium]MDH5334634.1 hypothetical protein [Thermoleophilia bacterium]
MTETTPTSPPPTTHRGAADEDLALLRRLLVTPEQAEVDALRLRLDDPRIHARDVSGVLAEAIVLRAREDDELQRALQPIFARTLRLAIQEDPALVADALYPVLGPAIRKAVAHALRDLVQSLNRILSRAFSIRAIRWRWEAWRSGRSFAEVVLAHTLLYRVEQVFLIHADTGLVLQHVAAPDVPTEDPSLVAGMLTAIQDFVRDSFGAGERETLDEFEVGELVVWIARGPEAVIAAVIRGTPLPIVRTTLEEQLERVHLTHREALQAFDGDASAFADTGASLEDCLLVEVGDRSPGGGA